MASQISIRSVTPGIAVITLGGPLTLGTTLKIADSQIQKAIQSGAIRLVFDMAAVPYIDSAGLGALIHTYGLAKAQGGTVRLAAVSERVATLLTMTQMNTILPIDPDVETSLASIS